MTINCDVLVVGAGPAGSSAARAAAEKGAKTILIDKKVEIGFPVQCGEGIGKYLFSYLPFQIPKEQLIWNIEGMLFWSDGIQIEKTGERWKGYSIERKNFDKWLSKEAEKNGVELWTNAELHNLEINRENRVKKAIVKRKNKTFEIQPNILIAADGVESTVLKLLNLYHPKIGDIAEVYSWEMKNLNLYKPHLEQIYIDDFTPSGYAYIFPKSKNVANVGIGGIFPQKKIEKYFAEFLENSQVKKQLKTGEYVIEKTKKAIWNDLTEKWIYENVVLVGDAANQNLKPFIEGIIPSIICGDIAGKVAADKNIINFSHEKYLETVKNVLKTEFEMSRQMLDYIGMLLAKKGREKYLQFFSLVTEICNEKEIEEFNEMEYSLIKSKLMEKKNEM